jgi:RNA polymerase sigma-70 factor (ECF subfamily)
LKTHSDEHLMQAVVLGDGNALTFLVERHHTLLLGYMYRMVGGDRALAQDLTQETFVRMMRAIQQEGYRSGHVFKTWLYAIATNLARDHFKSAHTRYSTPGSTSSGERHFPELADASSGPEELVLSAERVREVANAVEQLVPEYRAVVLLRFYSEMSLQDIATALQIPVGTVKSRLSVGCRRLRELLDTAEDVTATGAVERAQETKGNKT